MLSNDGCTQELLPCENDDEKKFSAAALANLTIVTPSSVGEVPGSEGGVE